MTSDHHDTTTLTGPELLAAIRAQRSVEQATRAAADAAVDAEAVRLDRLLAAAKADDDVSFTEACEAAGMTRDGGYKRLQARARADA